MAIGLYGVFVSLFQGEIRRNLKNHQPDLKKYRKKRPG